MCCYMRTGCVYTNRMCCIDLCEWLLLLNNNGLLYRVDDIIIGVCTVGLIVCKAILCCYSVLKQYVFHHIGVCITIGDGTRVCNSVGVFVI